MIAAKSADRHAARARAKFFTKIGPDNSRESADALADAAAAPRPIAAASIQGALTEKMIIKLSANL
jgi:hypothetical protein